jgi:small GTP-binding protein
MNALKILDLKLIVLGNSNVGKTTMIECVANRKFTEAKRKGSYRFKFKLSSSTNVNLKIQVLNCDKDKNFDDWEKFDGVIFMYDITNLPSFNSLENWILKLKRHRPKQLIKVMVGNKSDCCGRQVENDKAFEIAKKNDMLLLETSAKTGSNIDALFKNITYSLYSKGNCMKSTEDETHWKLSWNYLKFLCCAAIVCIVIYHILKPKHNIPPDVLQPTDERNYNSNISLEEAG